MSITRKIGAWLQKDGNCEFTVWAPEAEHIEVLITGPESKQIALQKAEFGYWQGSDLNTNPNSRYLIRLNGELERPDPASMFQPDGVHKATALVDHDAFNWTDKNWQSLPLEQYIIYELHTGTFTDKHT